MSAIEREELQILQIIEHSESDYTGGMNENWDVTVYDFGLGEHMFTMDWYIHVDTIGIDTLEFNQYQYFVNGDYLDWDGDQITASGAYGYGTLGETHYEWKNEFHEGITTYIRNTETFEVSRTYYKEGLPRKITYFNGDTMSYYRIEDNGRYDLVIDSLAAFAKDSMIHIYDSLERYKNSYKGGEHIPHNYFYERPSNAHVSDYYKYYKISINGQDMASYLKANLDYTPEILIIEIYPYAALVFHFNKEHSMYTSPTIIFLEG